VLDEMADGTEFVEWGEARLSVRAYLKRFLFADDRISTQIKYLSGGERSRLLLARILKNGGNFLVLDEPTNDLDLQTLRVLEEALIAFPGVVCVVSHDRYFLNRVCTDVLAFEGDERITHSVGDYDYYVEKKARAQEARAQRERAFAPLVQKPVIRSAEASSAKSKPRKLSFKEARELEGMEAAILEVEEKIAAIEALFVDPDFNRKHGQRTEELKQEIETGRARLAELYARWQELEAIRAASHARTGES
jgi:ATP-binding cassette subfamily F protein uup